MKSGDKKGQLKISFGMIFSIILIIVFLAFAFFGIKKFLGVNESATIAQFESNLQNDVDKLWTGPQGQQEMKYKLPNKIDGVCFEDGYENFYFEPLKYGRGSIEHIDLSGTLGSRESLCFENSGGYVTLTLKKDFGDSLVTISRN